MLFSHPDDFTPVCTTELGTVAKYHDRFTERGVKVFALSCNSVESHAKWIVDIEAAGWNDGKKVWPGDFDLKTKSNTFGIL